MLALALILLACGRRSLPPSAPPDLSVLSLRLRPQDAGFHADILFDGRGQLARLDCALWEGARSLGEASVAPKLPLDPSLSVSVWIPAQAPWEGGPLRLTGTAYLAGPLGTHSLATLDEIGEITP